MLVKSDFSPVFEEAAKYLDPYEIIYTFQIDAALFDQDGFSILYQERTLTVIAVNKRSLLYGLYTFLRHLGYDWLYPGEEGEVKPDDCTALLAKKYALCECASLKYRGIVLEGANSIEHLIALFEWLPKVYYNSYFMQFLSPFYFFRNWYEHVHNPLWEKEAFSPEIAQAYRMRCIQELKKRDLLIHDVGHGWTAKVLGIDASGWDVIEPETLKRWQAVYKPYLAELEGERKFIGGIPSNTNLCYSSSTVQNMFASTVVSYAQDNPTSDYLHVWLADEFNNVCDCKACRKKRVSDWYVQILNLIDQKLLEEGLATKIVFLLYNDLLWPPIQEKIKNPERFVMMFAPITRSFDTPLMDDQASTMSTYRYNDVTLPIDTAENLAYLKGWKETFAGDCFDFDYHLGRAHYGDFSYLKISQILAEDILSLPNFGLQGMLMCQENRAFFPTSLPNYLGGLLLWNTSLNKDVLIEAYYSKRFLDGEAVLSFSKEISRYISMDFWNAKYTIPAPKFAENFSRIFEIALQYQMTNPKDPLFLAIIRYTELFSQAMLSLARDGCNEGPHWDALVNFIREYEKCNPALFDCFRLLDLMKRAFGVRL